jgi:hypothetical protein
MCAIVASNGSGTYHGIRSFASFAINDGLFLARRVGGPGGLRANGAHAPHERERFERAPFLAPFAPSVASRTQLRARAPLRRDGRYARVKIRPRRSVGGAAEAFGQLALMARPAASVSVN